MSAPTIPTEDQLLVLADRTESKRLSADEAGTLRAGIRALVERQRKAAATIGELENRVRELRNKAERAAQDLALTEPYRVPCTSCKAGVGERCRAVRGYAPPRTPHVARLHAAQAGRDEAPEPTPSATEGATA